ncbi:hypothetical protein ScPMuIL_016820 [Solemya velum]
MAFSNLFRGLNKMTIDITLVFLALTITMVWTKPSPIYCERNYKDCMFDGGEKFECHFRRVQCLYHYCVTIVRVYKRPKRPAPLRLSACIAKYGIPSPMWVDLSK